MFAAGTLIELIALRLAETDSRPALAIRRGTSYVPVAWPELAADVWRRASALQASGLAPGDRVATLAENRYDWIITDFAVLLAGAVHVPLHAALSGSQMAWQLRHSGARLAFVAGLDMAARLASAVAELPPGIEYVALDERFPLGEHCVATLPEFLARGTEAEGRELAARHQRSIGPQHLASLLYTSGTTGNPKGVMLSHGNLASNAQATVAAYHQQASDVKLNFLPLSHVFARTCDLYTWLATGSQLALATSRETVLADCQAVQPTLLNGVPYFFEKLARHVSTLPAASQAAALQSLLGGRVRLCCSGGAPLPRAVFEFFAQQGVPLRQGYGLSESSPVITLSSRTVFRPDSVGKAVAGVEVRIADDGEVLTRGPHVMLGYWNDTAATAAALHKGWLHTGDLGRLDADGFLYITGRKKELIVTSAGKKIVPTYLEGLLAADPLIEQVMVVGEGRKYLAALVVPDRAAFRAALAARGVVLAEQENLAGHAAALALLHECVASRLAAVSHYEQVPRCALLPRPFSQERGELTPKLSLRRHAIELNFAAEIEQLYS